MKILKFKNFVLEQNDPGEKEEIEIKKLDQDINNLRLELKKKKLEELKRKKKDQEEGKDIEI
jgi:hypothetical protein